MGVDPQSRVRLLDLVRTETQKGTCVLYTTHYMEEAESLCDKLAIIDHGKIIAAGTLPELRAMMGERDILRLAGSFEPDVVREPLLGLDGAELVQMDEKTLTLAVPNASAKPRSPNRAWRPFLSSSPGKNSGNNHAFRVGHGNQGLEAVPA